MCGLEPATNVAIGPIEKLQLQSNAIASIAARAQIMAATGEIVSPCISVCRMNAATALCEGCFRTRDEIAAWGNAGDDAKLATWEHIEGRMAALQA